MRVKLKDFYGNHEKPLYRDFCCCVEITLKEFDSTAQGSPPEADSLGWEWKMVPTLKGLNSSGGKVQPLQGGKSRPSTNNSLCRSPSLIIRSISISVGSP